MEKYLFVCVFLLVGCVYCQEESHAVRRGTVEVHVKQTLLSEFLPRLEEFQETVSWYLSVYCKRDEGHCWGEDKQIRRHDVIIQDAQTSIDDVSVIFHIQDRYDTSRAGMENQQVRRAFQKVGNDIDNAFGKTIDVVSPEKQGMEIWLIAVIAVCCVVGVALIITIFVLGCKQCEASGKRETREKLIEEHLRKEYSLSQSPPADYSMNDEVQGKENPGYDSDSNHSEQPGTSRSNSTENSPPPDYNGFKTPYNSGLTGEYNMKSIEPTVPPKTSIYEMTDL